MAAVCSYAIVHMIAKGLMLLIYQQHSALYIYTCLVTVSPTTVSYVQIHTLQNHIKPSILAPVSSRCNGSVTRYVKLRVTRAPGIPGMFSTPPRVSDPAMQHGTCVTHAPWWMLWSLNSGFLWSQWRGKPSRHSRRMRNFAYLVGGPCNYLLIIL